MVDVEPSLNGNMLWRLVALLALVSKKAKHPAQQNATLEIAWKYIILYILVIVLGLFNFYHGYHKIICLYNGSLVIMQSV
jgi:hypothetical protein